MLQPRGRGSKPCGPLCLLPGRRAAHVEDGRETAGRNTEGGKQGGGGSLDWCEQVRKGSCTWFGCCWTILKTHWKGIFRKVCSLTECVNRRSQSAAVLLNGEMSCNRPVTQGHFHPALRIQIAQYNVSASKRKWILKHWQKYIYKEGLFLPTEEWRSAWEKISPIHCISEITICRDTNKTIYQGMWEVPGPGPSDAGHRPGRGEIKP